MPLGRPRRNGVQYRRQGTPSRTGSSTMSVSPRHRTPLSPIIHVMNPTDGQTAREQIRPTHSIPNSMVNFMPTFAGRPGESVKYFLAQFAKVADMANIPQDQRTIILRAKLTGKAQEWLHANVLMQFEDSFESFSQELTKYFEGTKSVTQDQTEFHSLGQGTQHSVRELAQSVKNAGYKLINAAEQSAQTLEKFCNTILLGKFIAALRADLRLELKKVEITTYDQAVAIAERIEIALNDESNLVNTVGKAERTAQKEPHFDKKELWREFEKMKVQDSNCSHCGAQGHYPAHCPEKIFCMACGRTGHLWGSCYKVENMAEKIRKAQNPTISQNNFRGNFRPRGNNQFVQGGQNREILNGPQSQNNFQRNNQQNRNNFQQSQGRQGNFRGGFRGNRRGSNNFVLRGGNNQNGQNNQVSVEAPPQRLAIDYQTGARQRQ